MISSPCVFRSLKLWRKAGTEALVPSSRRARIWSSLRDSFSIFNLIDTTAYSCKFSLT